MPRDGGPCTDRVSIKPGAGILSALRHLNYRPWFAVAEFVDNALQSYLANRAKLPNARLSVGVAVEAGPPARITIRDDAAGIAAVDYARAFRPAEVPPDASGLSEFGMGMKSAACWFAPRWRVRTSAIGEGVERTLGFDIARIVHDRLEELQVVSTACAPSTHFTEIVLEEPYHVPVGRTLGRIKEHLTDIYRCYLRDGILRLCFNDAELRYEEPAVLRAPFYRDPSGPPVVWRKEISFDFGDLKARGFAALREKGASARSGFALFRRNRLIQGSGDEGWRPEAVFGRPNSYSYQRLFGELHLEGFEVSHTKDGFRWDNNEGPFAELLAEELDKGELPMLKQAEGYRQRAARPVLARSASAAVAGTVEDMQAHLPAAVPPAAEQVVARDGPTSLPPPGSGAPPPLAGAELSFTFREADWTVGVSVSDDPAQGDWLQVGDVITGGGEKRRIDIKVAVAHPFMARFAHRDPEVMQALVRVAAAFALAETLFRSTGAERPAAIRRTANDLLRDVFSTL